MRIIGGSYRGKILISPTSANVRPTSDRARESVFNILYSKLEGSLSEVDLLDVFSGSGAFALEAVSRGVRSATLLDIDTRDLQKNVALFPKEKDKIKILRQDATNLGEAIKKYQLVFMDAPYNKGLSEQALQQLAQKKWLDNEALCVVELEKNENIIIPPSYKQIDERKYGLAKVLFLQYLG